MAYCKIGLLPDDQSKSCGESPNNNSEGGPIRRGLKRRKGVWISAEEGKAYIDDRTIIRGCWFRVDSSARLIRYKFSILIMCPIVSPTPSLEILEKHCLRSKEPGRDSLPTTSLFFSLGNNLDMAHIADTSQCLTSESIRHETLQIFKLCQFRSRITSTK